MKRLAWIWSVVLLIGLLGAGCSSRKDTSFVFTVTDGTAELTRYTGNAERVEIPSVYEGYDVVSVAARAFYNCTNVTTVVLPAGVVAVGDEAFAVCPSLTAFDVSDANPVYTVRDGVLFSKDKTTLVQYPQGKEGAYTVPDGVTTIGQQAFSRCNGLTALELPASLTAIKAAAFYDCGKLTELVIPDGVTEIGPTALCRCSSLETITLPAGLTKLETGLFSDCTALRSLTLPAGVTEVASAAFWNCTALEEIRVAEENTALMAKDGVLFSGDGTDLIRYPAGKTGETYSLPDTVLTLSEEAFSYNAHLKSIRLPGRLKEVPISAFYLCEGLETVILDEGITAIQDKAFASCTSLTGLALPATLTTIGSGAFNNNDSLQTVILPESLTTIGDSAFSYCDQLLTVTIPDSVTAIGTTAFGGCDNLRLYGAEGGEAERYAAREAIVFNDNDATTTTAATE